MTLKELRQDSGLKALKVAQELGISRNHLYNLESGKTSIDKLKKEKLCEVYRTDMETIENAIV